MLDIQQILQECMMFLIITSSLKVVHYNDLKHQKIFTHCLLFRIFLIDYISFSSSQDRLCLQNEVYEIISEQAGLQLKGAKTATVAMDYPIVVCIKIRSACELRFSRSVARGCFLTSISGPNNQIYTRCWCW